MTHPSLLDFGPDQFFEKHLAYIAGRPDVWYVPTGPLYAYQIVRENTVVTPLGPKDGWERFAVHHNLDPKIYDNAVTLRSRSRRRRRSRCVRGKGRAGQRRRSSPTAGTSSTPAATATPCSSRSGRTRSSSSRRRSEIAAGTTMRGFIVMAVLLALLGRRAGRGPRAEHELHRDHHHAHASGGDLSREPQRDHHALSGQRPRGTAAREARSRCRRDGIFAFSVST